MKRVLVTGGSGFIGRQAIAGLIRRGYDVHAIARHVPSVTNGATWHVCDLLDGGSPMRELLEQIRPQLLLHLAWCTEHGVFWDASSNLDWVAASLQLARAFVGAGGQEFIGVGSCAEYDWTDGHCSEARTPCRPGSLYGISKLATHRVLESFFEGQGLRYAWARVFFLYGETESPGRLVTSLARALARGEDAVCRSGSHERDLLHVEDVGDALAALVASAACGPVNIGAGRTVALGEIATRLGELMGRPDLVRVLAAAPTPQNPARLGADTGRLRDEVGWVPRVTLEEGLARIAGLRAGA